jgi:hypothetical protein
MQIVVLQQDAVFQRLAGRACGVGIRAISMRFARGFTYWSPLTG